MPTTPATLLVASGANLSTTAGSTQYWACATTQLGRASTEADKQIPYAYAGIFSKLYIRLTANTTTAPSNLSLRKNGSTVNLTITIPTGTSGIFEDTTHSDSIAAGDLMAYETISGATGVLQLSIISVYFANTQSSEAVTRMATAATTAPVAFSTPSTSRFQHLAGLITAIGTEALGAHDRIMKAGTLKNMSVYVAVNARVTDCPMKSRINAADGTLLITIVAGTTGLFQDITHNDNVADGDLVDTVIVYGTGSETISYWHFGIDYVAATNQRFTMLNTSGSSVTNNAGITNYFAISGGTAAGATEAERQLKTREAMTLTNMSILIAANTVTASSTLRLRKNGSNGNLLITLAASTTGVFNDLSNSDAIVASDDLNYQFTAGATGTSIQMRGIQLNAQIPLTVVKTVTETKTIAETSFTRLKKAFKTLSETETIGAGTLARINGALKIVATQTINIGESVVRAIVHPGTAAIKTLSDTIVISELRARLKSIWRYQP